MSIEQEYLLTLRGRTSDKHFHSIKLQNQHVLRQSQFLPRHFCMAEYRPVKTRILSAEVFFLERRRERSAGMLILSAALILTALAAWFLWNWMFGGAAEKPAGSAVLIHRAEEGTVHG